MRVSAFTLYIYSIYRKINNVIETGEKNMYKEFHKQLDYIISEMKKEKEKNPRSFAFDDDNFNSTKENNAFSVCSKIILNMSKSRLNKLISCRGLNRMPAFCTWRSNSFCTSGYYSNPNAAGPYTVSRSNFNSLMDSKTISNRKGFIRFICAVISNASYIYPKFRKQIIKKGEGLAVYSSIHYSMNWKGAQKDYYNLLKRSKDNRIKRFLIKNMQAQTLIKFNEKEIQTGNASFSSDINYVINERLKTYSMNDFDRFIEDGLSEDRTSVKYDWSRSISVIKCMEHLAGIWTPEEKVNKFQTICDVIDNNLQYGFYESTAARCLHVLIFYIPKAKIPFILNRSNERNTLNDSLKWIIESDENRWSS